MAQGEPELLRKLGDGWLGATHLARDPSSKREVVIKSIGPALLRGKDVGSRLAALAAALAAPPASGIVPILRCDNQADGSVHLTMPRLDGENLAQVVARSPGEPATHSLWIARELALLLEASHRAGHRHLGLRPTQVLISPDSKNERGISVSLLGLGLVDALGLQRPERIIESNRVFLAPEQSASAGNTKLTEKADVYALGVLLLHLFLGSLPSQKQVEHGRGDAETMISGRVIRDETTRLIKRMLAVDPSQRPTMAEVTRELAVESQAALHSATLAPPPDEAFAATEQSGPSSDLPSKAAPPPPDKDGQTGQLYGNFRIIGRIGKGGMGVVYEAEHKQIGRRAAVKILHPQFAHSQDYASRFLNEARAVNIIRHPGLVEIFEYGQQPDGTLYIVMEYLQGESVRMRLHQHKELLAVPQILDWSLQIASALSATHAKGIIHRDLKPENIMVIPDPRRPEQELIKLLDFGIAKVGAPKLGPSSEENYSDTAAGAVMGTPIYMAPEQHGSAGIVDGKADVFSFGVMLYELLAGKRPYKDSALNMLGEPAPPLKSVRAETPAELALLIQRMLSIVPKDRPTMAEVEAQLKALISRQQKRRQPMLPFLLASAAVVLGLSGFVAHRMLRPLSLAESRERALALVKRHLNSAEANEGLQAAQALGKSRDVEYRPLLEALLTEKRPALAGAAARGLGEMSAIEAQPLLLALLERTSDASVRIEAATALAQLSHQKGVSSLRSLLESDDEITKVEAALRLLEYGDRAGAALLHKRIDRDDLPAEHAIPVLLSLARAGDAPARQRLEQLFRSSLQSGRDDPLLLFSLTRFGDAAAQRRLKELSGRPGPEQVVAARFLSALGQPDGYDVLLKIGADGKVPERQREVAMDGLGDSGQTDAAGVMARTLTESALTTRLRLAAAGSILQLAGGASGAYASRSLGWARAALGSDSRGTRELAVMLLGDLETDESIAPLRLALKDKEREVRSGAARALGRKSVRAALEALADALQDSAEDVRAAGMKSMGQVVAALRKKGEQNFESAVVEHLQQLSKKGTAIDRIVAAGTLLRMGDASQHSLLRDGLHAADALARRLAVELIDTEPELLAALQDGDMQVRFAAARRLAALGRRESVAVLLAVREAGGPAGLAAYAWLKKLGEAAEPPTDLMTLFVDRPLREKEAVLDALPDLPANVALDLLLRAALDVSNMIRRRAAEIAFALYQRTMQSAFRTVLLELRNDADVVVRSRVTELLPQLPSPAQGAKEAATLEPTMPKLSPSQESAASRPPAKETAPATVATPARSKPRDKAKAKDDAKLKTMGRVEIYVLKNGRCKLAESQYLPPGDHVVNVGGRSQTVSVYAGATIPIRQCP